MAACGQGQNQDDLTLHVFSNFLCHKQCCVFKIKLFKTWVSSGNAAVIKPSEVCVHTAKVMEDLLQVYIDKVRTRLVTSRKVKKVFARFGVWT